MIVIIKRHGFTVIATILLYVFFFERLGARTLAEHTYRVCTTPEARELVHEVFYSCTSWFGDSPSRGFRWERSRYYR